jgi:hypothetical protein
MARLDMPSTISPGTSRSRSLSTVSGSCRRHRLTRRDYRLAVRDAAQGVNDDGDAEYVLLGE